MGQSHGCPLTQGANTTLVGRIRPPPSLVVSGRAPCPPVKESLHAHNPKRTFVPSAGDRQADGASRLKNEFDSPYEVFPRSPHCLGPPPPPDVKGLHLAVLRSHLSSLHSPHLCASTAPCALCRSYSRGRRSPTKFSSSPRAFSFKS